MNTLTDLHGLSEQHYKELLQLLKIDYTVMADVPLFVLQTNRVGVSKDIFVYFPIYRIVNLGAFMRDKEYKNHEIVWVHPHVPIIKLGKLPT